MGLRRSHSPISLAHMQNSSKIALIASLLALLAQPTLAEAANPPVLEPVGPWRVDYAPDECRLLRTFGTGADAVVLRIARGGAIGSFDMVIAGSSIPRLPQAVEVALRTEPQGQIQRTEGYSLAVPSGNARFIRWFDGNAALLDEFASTQQIEIAANHRSTTRYSVKINLVQVKTALAALQTCYAGLLKSWGVDEASLARLIAARPLTDDKVTSVMAQRLDLPRPKGQPGRWATTDDYPTEALRQEISGSVVALLNLGETGKPDKCHVAVSSSHAILDQQTCALLLQRARFTPPIDQAGNAVRSITVERVRWMIPQG